MPTAGNPKDGDSGSGNDGGRGTSSSSSSSSNPFIRFKNHIDNNIHRGYEIWSSMLWTIPSTLDSFSRSPKDGARNNNSYSPSSTTTASTSGALSRDTLSSPTPSSPNCPIPIPIYGGGEDTDGITDDKDVTNWVLHSPYSPLNLQHLRQPVPQHVPHVHHSSFTSPPGSSLSSSSPQSSSRSPPPCTFRDAFEDLLFVSAGQPLPDLNVRFLFSNVFDSQVARKFSETIPGSPIEMKIPFLTRETAAAQYAFKLGHMGLWQSYFPQLTVTDRTEPWFAARRRMLLLSYLWDAAPRVGSSGGWDKVWDSDWNGKGSLEWRQNAFSGDGEESPESRNTSTSAADNDRSSDAAPPPQQQQPEVEEDLYASLAASDFPPTAATTTSEKKKTTPQNADTETTETTYQPDGGKVVRTYQYSEDKAGGRSTLNITTERYDAAGNLISHSKSTSSQRSWSSEKKGTWFWQK